jgi:hypothetical protein
LRRSTDSPWQGALRRAAEARSRVPHLPRPPAQFQDQRVASRPTAASASSSPSAPHSDGLRGLWLFVQDFFPAQSGLSPQANLPRQHHAAVLRHSGLRYCPSPASTRSALKPKPAHGSPGRGLKPGTISFGRGEHLSGRPLLTPNEVMKLGSERPIVLLSGQSPYLLNQLNYLVHSAHAGCFDPNPMHLEMTAEPES